MRHYYQQLVVRIQETVVKKLDKLEKRLSKSIRKDNLQMIMNNLKLHDRMTISKSSS